MISDARGGDAFDYVLRAWRAAIDLRWQPAQRWRVLMLVGLEFDRRLQFESDGGVAVDSGAADAPFAGLSVVYRW